MASRVLTIRFESEELDTSTLQVSALEGKEALSQLFSFDVRVVCTDPDGLDTSSLVGASAAIVFEWEDVTADPSVDVAQIFGMIAEAEDMLDPETEYRTYRIRLVPRAYRSTMIQTQEIFLNQSIPEIIQAKLARVGLGAKDVELRLFSQYAPREFVVQYKETDLAFISRLAEHLGISFHFEHREDRDVMVFCDENSLRPPIVEGKPVVEFHPRGDKLGVFALSTTARMIPATYVAEDYNYMTPDVDLTGKYDLASAYAGGVIEYGPNYLTPAEGAALACVRAEERQATKNVLSGESVVDRFHAGATFVLEKHPRLPKTSLLLVEVEHRAAQNTLTHSGVGSFYDNTFRAIDAGTPYRPPRLTPKPRIAGVISAVVEPHTDGRPGQYAEIDEYGRYTVRFFFDPSPLGVREFSSLRARMAQPHAGENYGHHFPLKPGIEVVVAFSEGDPDRPVILGAVPNPVTPSPVTKASSLFNKIQTASGIFMEMKDV